MTRSIRPVRVQAELVGTEGETQHLIWRCPECGSEWSEDYEAGDSEPLFASCGRTRHHADGQVSEVQLYWQDGDAHGLHSRMPE